MLKFGGSSCLIGDPSWGGADTEEEDRGLLSLYPRPVFFYFFRLTETEKNGFSHCWIFFSRGFCFSSNRSSLADVRHESGENTRF